MTKRENFVAINAILNEVGHTEFDEFIAHEIELLGRKRTSTKPTKTQIQNAAIKASILEVLGEADEPMTIGDINKALGGEHTPQKLSALLRLLGEGEKGSGEVHKEMVKGKAVFTLA